MVRNRPPSFVLDEGVVERLERLAEHPEALPVVDIVRDGTRYVAKGIRSSVPRESFGGAVEDAMEAHDIVLVRNPDGDTFVIVGISEPSLMPWDEPYE
ncbi:MAG TPA: hypothetical protein VFE63_10015 [Roseiarcus sp.]|jgi:hypothetical protein|nr:hypothetical protein [Roseiarcus sp.]